MQGYVPTNETDPDTKEDFYNTFQGVVHRLPNRDLVILMGDFNAKSVVTMPVEKKLGEGTEWQHE